MSINSNPGSKKVRLGKDIFSLENVTRDPSVKNEFERVVVEIKAKSLKDGKTIKGADFKRAVRWIFGKEGDNIFIIGKNGKIPLIISKISADSATIEFDNSLESCGYEPISFRDNSLAIDELADRIIFTGDEHLSFLNKKIGDLNSDIEKLEEEKRYYQEMYVRTGNSNFCDLANGKTKEIKEKDKERERTESLVIGFQYYICK